MSRTFCTCDMDRQYFHAYAKLCCRFPDRKNRGIVHDSRKPAQWKYVKHWAAWCEFSVNIHRFNGDSSESYSTGWVVSVNLPKILPRRSVLFPPHNTTLYLYVTRVQTIMSQTHDEHLLYRRLVLLHVWSRTINYGTNLIMSLIKPKNRNRTAYPVPNAMRTIILKECGYYTRHS